MMDYDCATQTRYIMILKNEIIIYSYNDSTMVNIVFFLWVSALSHCMVASHIPVIQQFSQISSSEVQRLLPQDEREYKKQLIDSFNGLLPQKCDSIPVTSDNRSVTEISAVAMKNIYWSSVLDNQKLLQMIIFSPNPNVYDRRGRTLLTWACGHIGDGETSLADKNALALVTMLHDNPATNFNAQDVSGSKYEQHAYKGYTGFMHACEKQRLQLIAYMLALPDKKKIDFNIKNQYQQSAFMLL